MHTVISGHSLKNRFSRSSFVTEFPLTTDQLSELHDPKSLAAFVRLFGNEDAIYKYLKTDKRNGCTFVDEDPRHTNRYKTYGDNRIPERSSKSFFKLVLEAMEDQTMISLSIAAVISFALGLYETLGQPPEYDENGVKLPQVDWVEGVAIMIAVLVVVGVGAANDYQKERRFVMLNRKKENRDVTVVRNGSEQLISIHDLMVGDLLSLQTGEVVPADCILVYGSCECDESALTGESDTIKKTDLRNALEKYEELTKLSENIDIGVRGPNGEKTPDPMLISGSKLLSGLGQAVVTNVGVNSMHGRTMMSLKIEPEATPLQARLNSLADSISIYGSVIGLLLFLILFIRFLTYLPKGRKYHSLKPAQKGSRFMDIFITAVTVIVVAVPEGLPLAVTLALAFATTRMTKDGNLVRVLRACETMGSATAVCSDKTGTLTQNRMTVVKGLFGDSDFNDMIDMRSGSLGPSKKDASQGLSDVLKVDILRNICLNSTAFENKNLAGDTRKTNLVEETVNSIWRRKKKMKGGAELSEGGQQPIEPFIGSKTETALLSMAKDAFGMIDLQLLRDNIEELGVLSIVQVIPFESSRKWGGIVTKLSDGSYRLYVKGASELLLKRCSYKADRDGEVVKMSADIYQEAADKIKEMAMNALRTISLVHKDFEGVSFWPPEQLKDPSNPSAASPDLLFGDELYPTAKGMPVITTNDNIGFTLDSIVGIQDPLRPGVQESVEQCKRSGVTVRMVTGDNYLTAKAIAMNCGILTQEDLRNPDCAMEGPVFRKLSKQQQRAVIPNLRVLARSSSNDKRILVEMLKKMGELVAVTGDGTNDAPALTLADVGFSMGIAGTEVAREASDIILMNDDFSAIVNAIKWGRCVSISIKKFIQFQLTVNITAVILTFVTAVASSDEGSVFTAVQLLWVNLIMDTLAALALATDKPDNNILDRKPNGRSSPLISVSTWKMILGQSVLQLIVVFTLHLSGHRIFFPGDRPLTGHEKQQLHALSFNTFVWLQFFKLIVSRKLDEGDGISDWRARITASNLNFFQDITRNFYFLLILAIVGILQVIIMYLGGAAFSIVVQTRGMWATAIICGMLSLPVGALIRICPDEWAIAIFPARLFNNLKYIIGLEFLRRGKKKEDEESLLVEGEPNHYHLIGFSAFERAKSDVIFHKEHFKDHEVSYLNPMSIIRRWSSSKESESPSSDDEHSFIASLTMVPTLVGGAVGGFSQMSDCGTEKKRPSSQPSTENKD